MIEPGESLSRLDLERVAELHVAAIDDSLPSLLGRKFTARFYRFVSASASEWLFVERLDGRIESACLLSLGPDSLYGRIVRSLLPWLALHGLAALFTQPAFRTFLRSYVADLVSGGHAQQPAPEITYVFTSSERRGHGLGNRLIERIEAFLIERNVPVYHVKTIDNPENRALSFYDRAGFSRLGTFQERGHTFVAFRKTLRGA